MTNVIDADGGCRFLRALLVAAVCALLSACAVAGVEAQRSAGAAKFNALQVRVEHRVIPKEEMLTPANEPLASPNNIERVEQNLKALYARLDQGFRERFPEMASSYGLSISSSAATVLTVRVMSTVNTCTNQLITIRGNQCATRARLEGAIADERGSPMWTLKASVLIQSRDQTGQTFYDEVFPEFARSWLDTMKQQGMIR